jgi:hypothetical protein
MATAYKEQVRPYTLGRGIVSIAKDDDYANGTDLTLGRLWQDLWHVKEFKITMSADELEHETYRSGIKRVDRTVILKQAAKFSFVIDVPVVENVLLALMGDEVVDVEQAADTLVAVSLTVQELGKWHEILNDGDNVYNLEDFEITDDATPAVELTLHEDYDVDLNNGRIIFYGDGPLTIVATDIVKITATIPEVDIHTVEGGGDPRMERHVWFAGDPAGGVIQSVRGWGLLKPSGDLSMIGDDWQNFTIEGSFMSHADYGDLGFSYREHGMATS